MASYRHYYFIPQLSVLAYGQPPPMSPRAFMEKAAPMLGEKDAVLMGRLDPASGDGASSGCEFVDGWLEWEKGLRLSLAGQRAAALGREAASETPIYPSGAAEAAAKALGAETPLEGEIILDKARWEAVEALQGSELFHRKTVFAYFVKLLILERQASFQAEAGFSEYKSLYDSILGGIK